MIVAEPSVPESHVKPRLIGEIESFLSGLVADMASEPQPARGTGPASHSARSGPLGGPAGVCSAGI